MKTIVFMLDNAIHTRFVFDAIENMHEKTIETCALH